MKKIISILFMLVCFTGIAQHIITGPNIQTVIITGTVPVRVINTVTVTGTVTAIASGTQAVTGTVSATGNVGGYTGKITNAITTNTVAYSNGDNVGGIITVPLAVRNASGTAIYNDISLYSTESQTPALVVDVWSASPTGTFTNNSPQVVNDATNWLGNITISSSDYVLTSGGTVARACIKGIALATFGDGSKNIFLTIAITSATGAPTWTASTTGMTIKSGLLQD